MVNLIWYSQHQKKVEKIEKLKSNFQIFAGLVFLLGIVLISSVGN